MSEGSSSGGGTIMSTADWGYPSSHYSSNDYSLQDYYNFDDEDDDDLDSYYMDLPPIDMTERLKEVNRALAEDSTPIVSNRKTKLRFREVIAEFQSPRESDSDDGYGDSSDIMYDAEEDNDILFSSSSTLHRETEIRGVSSICMQGARAADTSQPSTIRESNSEESAKQKDQNSEVNKLLFGSWASASVSSPTPVSSFENKPEVVKPILKCDSASEKVILEDVLSSDLCCELGSLKGGSSSSFKANSSNSAGGSFLADTIRESAQKYIVPSNSNGRFSKCSKKDHDLSELDSEIEEEIDVFNKAYARKESLTDDNISDENEGSMSNIHQRDDSKTISGTNAKHKDQIELENKFVVDNKDSSSLSEDSIILELSQNQITLIRDSKPSVANCTNSYTEYDKSNKPKKTSKAKLTSDRSPTKTAKTRQNVRLSSSQPIPTIKSSLISPQKLPFPSLNKNSKGARTLSPSNNVTNFIRPSRSRTTESSRTSSPTKSPLSNPVQATRPQTARKGSPLPRRSTKFCEKKPLKAIHNQNSIPPESTQSFKMLPNSQGGKVRKAASTSDLSRGGFEEQRQMNEAVFDRWLQNKTRNANFSKKQKEDVKHVEDAVANAKLQERKRLAEEAFQQWLRRKREQLKEEKRCRAQQRKLEQQANYARTRTQCEEAYKEWCKRKQEELSASRRISGSSSNGRSRSLERTWIQEKTRKLYRAYLTTH